MAKDGKKMMVSGGEEGAPHRILFVCLGNICRSPAAEAVMKKMVEERGLADRFVIDSAGTAGYHIGEQPDRRMIIHARRRGIEMNHRCRRVSTADFDRFDLIIGMDRSNIEDLKDIAPSPEAEKKVVPMAEFIDMAGRYFDYVPDPYYEGSEGFELVLDLLENGCANLIDRLEPDRLSATK